MIKPHLKISEVSLKVWMWMTVGLMFLMVWLVLTLSHMAPQVAVLPQLFSPDIMKFNQLLEATNLDAGEHLTDRRLIEEMLIRFFVENYHFYIPDKWELGYRYGPRGPIARLADPAIYRKFINSKEGFAENTENNLTTTMADITRVTRKDNVFTVDFDTYAMDDMQPRMTGSRRATIKVNYFKGRKQFKSDFVNPFGLTVVSYDETVNVKK